VWLGACGEPAHPWRMWRRDNDSFYQWTRAGFGLVVLAAVVGVVLLSGATVGSAGGILRGLGGFALVAGAGLAVRAWFRA
jgi:hypothetical protein